MTAPDEPRRMGPLAADHGIVGETCRACDKPFEAGQFVTLIGLGPGDDPDRQLACRVGRPYNAVAIPVHWACATGF